ncbi:MAG: hypothetical protein ACP5O8_01730 [Candidatus Aenigmatarchaeota archaeon]
MAFQKESPSRKLIDTSFVWKREDGYYSVVDIMSRVDSAVLTTVAYNLYEDYPEFPVSSLKKYLELRNLPDPDGFSLVNEKESCYENLEAMVFVRALTKKRWENKEYNRIEIKNLVLESASFKEKADSLKNLKVSCGCARAGYQSICRPAWYQRRIFRDLRNYKDIPGSYIDSVFCKHVCIALDWLTLFYGTASFDYFGPSSHVIKASKIIIRDFLKHKPRYPDYKLNQLYLSELRREGINLNEPLLKFIWY